MAKRSETKPKEPKRGLEPEDRMLINLSMLTRFRIFVDVVRDAEGPVSFRSFMKNYGAHRTMSLTVDAIEKLSKQLLLRREILDDNGSPTGRYLADYEDVDKFPNKRTNGVSPRDITAHGDAWAEFGALMGELFDRMLDGTSDPRTKVEDLKEIRLMIRPRRKEE